MSKSLKVSMLGGIALAVVLMCVPVLVSAATISDPLFSNGDTTIDAAGNSTVNGTFTLQVGVNEVCEVLRTQAAPQAFTDTSVGGQLGYQFGTHTNVPFSVKVSPNTGTYTVTAQCAGIYQANRAVDGNDNVVVAANLGTVRVVANSSNSGGSNDSAPSWFTTWLNTFNITQCNRDGGTWNGSSCVTPPPASSSTACSEYATLSAGLSQGSDTRGQATGGRVGKLQSFLMYKGFDIPFLSNNEAPYGFYGSQTASAAASFKLANGCN